MSNNVDKQIEKLIDKTMKHVMLESPSSDFTAHVMSKVSKVSSNSVTTYKPLISKNNWLLILTVVTALIIYIFTGNLETTGWFNLINLNILTENKLSSVVASFEVSKTVVYAVVLIGIMISIQVLILKNYFEKRLAV